jgi:hypothetical protein
MSGQSNRSRKSFETPGIADCRRAADAGDDDWKGKRQLNAPRIRWRVKDDADHRQGDSMIKNLRLQMRWPRFAMRFSKQRKHDARGDAFASPTYFWTPPMHAADAC